MMFYDVHLEVKNLDNFTFAQHDYFVSALNNYFAVYLTICHFDDKYCFVFESSLNHISVVGNHISITLVSLPY